MKGNRALVLFFIAYLILPALPIFLVFYFGFGASLGASILCGFLVGHFLYLTFEHIVYIISKIVDWFK